MTTSAMRLEFNKLTTGNPEERSAHALEYMAYSLEAIEGHLRQISGALGGQNTVKQLVQEVQGVRVEIAKASGKR